MQHLVFAIAAGNLVWVSAHEEAATANEACNEYAKETLNDEARYEFVFVVASSHFVANI